MNSSKLSKRTPTLDPPYLTGASTQRTLGLSIKWALMPCDQTGTESSILRFVHPYLADGIELMISTVPSRDLYLSWVHQERKQTFGDPFAGCRSNYDIFLRYMISNLTFFPANNYVGLGTETHQEELCLPQSKDWRILGESPVEPMWVRSNLMNVFRWD